MQSNYTYVSSYEEGIERTLNSAVESHSRLACFFITLRFPLEGTARDDNNVISRFTDALKYQFNNYIDAKRADDKNVHKTAMHFIWAKEFGKINGNKHYHFNPLFNKDTFHTLGNYCSPSEGTGSLANMIQHSWCSALGVPTELNRGLVHFMDDKPCMWLENNNPQQRDAIRQRMQYLAKEETKERGDNTHSFGTSQAKPTMLDGRKYKK